MVPVSPSLCSPDFSAPAKTTLLRSLLTQADGRRIAVIVNESAMPDLTAGWSRNAPPRPARPAISSNSPMAVSAAPWPTISHPDHGTNCGREKPPLDAIVIETSGLARRRPPS